MNDQNLIFFWSMYMYLSCQTSFFPNLQNNMVKKLRVRRLSQFINFATNNIFFKNWRKKERKNFERPKYYFSCQPQDAQVLTMAPSRFEFLISPGFEPIFSLVVTPDKREEISRSWDCILVLITRRGSIEHELRYLTPLNSCSICTLAGTLELKRHRLGGRADCGHLTETLLAEVA